MYRGVELLLVFLIAICGCFSFSETETANETLSHRWASNASLHNLPDTTVAIQQKMGLELLKDSVLNSQFRGLVTDDPSEDTGLHFIAAYVVTDHDVEADDDLDIGCNVAELQTEPAAAETSRMMLAVGYLLSPSALLVLLITVIIFLVFLRNYLHWTSRGNIKETDTQSEENVDQGNIKYLKSPILIGMTDYGIETMEAVFGMTILEDEMFVIGYYSDVIKVYDTATLRYKREWFIEGLQCPGEIKSLDERKCLMVLDWTELGRRKTMYVVNKDGEMLEQWIWQDDFGRISFTKETTILETLHDQHGVAEYSKTGELIRIIKIQADDFGVEGLQHVIKMDEDRYFVSHGDPNDSVHRVFIMDGNGCMLKTFGGETGCGINQLHVPSYLIMDSDRNVLVLDRLNGRVRLLSSELKFKRDLVIRDDGIRYPEKMYLDESKGLTYLADNDIRNNQKTDGHIMVFKIIDL